MPSLLIEFCERNHIMCMHKMLCHVKDPFAEVHALDVLENMVAGDDALLQELRELRKVIHPVEQAKAFYAKMKQQDTAVAQLKESIDSLDKLVQDMRRTLSKIKADENETQKDDYMQDAQPHHVSDSEEAT
jgi:hypothetical protein